MIYQINKKIFYTVVEILLVVFFVVISVPFWEFFNNKSYASKAEFYNGLEKNTLSVYEETEILNSLGRIVVYNSKEVELEYTLLLKLNTKEYKNIHLSIGNTSKPIEKYDFLDSEKLFVLDKATINSNETYYHEMKLTSETKLSYEFVIMEN